MRLAEALEQSATSTLRRVASSHALAHDDGTTRAELIERLTERLADGIYLDEQVRTLSDDERTVLLSAHTSAGELRGQLVDQDYPGTLEMLAQRGLVYRVFAAAGPLRGEVYVIPDELLAALPTPRNGEAPPGGEPPPTSGERRISDPAFSLFALVSALTRTGGHLEREVRAWSEEPGGWAWDARWTFLQHLALSAGMLVHRADGALAAAPGLPRLLDQPAGLSERLLRAYVRDHGHVELTQAGFLRPDGAELEDTVALRRAVLEALELLPEQTWISLERVSEWLQRTRPNLVREQLTSRGLMLLEARAWSELEAPILRAFLLGPMYWLGMLATTRDGRLVSRRVAAPGAPRDGAAGTAMPEPCAWDGTAELVAPARAELGVLLRAERYLVLHERGRTSRYHLVQAHVAAALGTGGSIAECRQLLTRLTQAPLPAAVDERLSHWEQRFGALSIHPTVVLAARTADELDEAIAADAVRAFVRTRLGPTAVEVAAADALELAAALRESGHLPRIDAALRLAADARRTYGGLIDEQVLEFLLVSLLAFRGAWPERLAELEGSAALLERLERQFPPERLGELRTSAERLAGALAASSAAGRAPSRRGSKGRSRPSRASATARRRRT